MNCELCGNKTKVIHVNSKYGFICCDCAYKIRNSDEEKQREKKKMLEMYRKYGIDV